MTERINATSLRTSELRGGYTFIFLALLCILSICFNSLLTYCLVSNRKKTWVRKAKQLFYLVLSDLFAGIFLIPRTIFTRLDIPVKTYEMCAVFNYIVITTQVISFYHVLSLCVHRFMLIRKAHLPSQTDKCGYCLESCVIWIASVLACTPPFLFWGRHGDELTNCSFILTFGASDRPAIIYILVLFFLPWILTNAIYVAMVIKVMSTVHVQPATVMQLDIACQQASTAFLSKEKEQLRSRQTETTTLFATKNHDNEHQDAVVHFTASSQRCTIVKQRTSHQSRDVAACSTALEEPRTHELNITLSGHENDLSQKAVIQSSASAEQGCDNIQQSSSHPSVAVASGSETQESFNNLITDDIRKQPSLKPPYTRL